MGRQHLTDIQLCIVETYDFNPAMETSRIADKCGCSESYVRETIRKHR